MYEQTKTSRSIIDNSLLFADDDLHRGPVFCVYQKSNTAFAVIIENKSQATVYTLGKSTIFGGGSDMSGEGIETTYSRTKLVKELNNITKGYDCIYSAQLPLDKADKLTSSMHSLTQETMLLEEVETYLKIAIKNSTEIDLIFPDKKSGCVIS